MKQFFQIENIEQQVKKDIWGLQRQFKRAAKRRTVPTFAAPLETYWMMFHPNYRISSGDHLGLGGVRTKVSSHEFSTCVRHLLYAIYWRQWAPLRWAHAEAAQLPKTSKKTHPCAQVRLIFLFCPFGKALRVVQSTMTSCSRRFSAPSSHSAKTVWSGKNTRDVCSFAKI